MRAFRSGRLIQTIAATGAAALVLSMTAAANAAPAGPAAKPTGLPANAAAQIAALQQIKKSLTPAERKLDSRLVVARRERLNAATTKAVPQARTGVAVSKSGTTVVDVSVSAVTPGLLDRLHAAGATVRYASARLRTVRAAVPLTQVSTVAGWKDVVRVTVATGASTAHETGATPRPESKAAKSARLHAQLKTALAHAQPAVGQGAVVSEGDKTHAADKARARFKVTGTGVKVCALSDGVDSLAAEEAAGELPDVDVLPGQAGIGDEGTAMLEIVHDLAPNATLGFATAFTSDASFADNIRALRFQAHCDIVVDDVLYFNEDPFQDGPIAQSVNAITADGALYFSSAGNEGNTIDGTSGNYEGDFVNSGQTLGKVAGTAHDFDPGSGVQIFEPLSDASIGVPVTLFWADPLGHATDDYDMYLLDSDNNIVAFSQDVQDGTQDPFEILGTTFDSGLHLAVLKFAGADRYFQLSALGGRYKDSAAGLKAYVTPGVTRGHSAAANAFSVAAAPAAGPLPFDLEPGDPPNPSGPFPNPYTTAQQPERFTSDGPRRVFFNPDGTPITPGNTSATGGTVRQKPDVTAADGVSSAVDGFSPFFGTSAAAPHAAAIAALVLSGNPGATTADVRDAYAATALDLTPPGVDTRTGVGVIRADRVLAYTGATPQPLVVTGNPTVTPVSGDGDPYLEPGESATVDVPAVNQGDGTATGVSVRLVSSDPQVTVTPRTRSYGSIAAGASKSKPFTIALPASYPLGKRVHLTATVTFAGVLSPRTTTVTIPTGQPASTAKTFAYTGPAVPIPDYDATGASVPISVAGLGYAASITFSVDGSACSTAEGATTVGIDHTFVSDLVGTLRNPNGAVAEVFAAGGGGGNNMCQVVFDDAAATPFAAAAPGDAPFTGSWRPDDSLASLIDESVDGTWTFTAVDTASADTGSIRAVSLHLTGFVPNS
jgi:subtilisin-like proprotein convertase family protein